MTAKFARRAILAVSVLLLIALMGLHRDWFEPRAIQARLATEPMAPLIFLLAHLVVGLALVVPRTVMGVAAGLLFGLVWGTVLTTAGLMLGAWAAFGIARLWNRNGRSLPGSRHLQPLLARLEHAGWRGVWALRLLPLPHSPVNYALGFSPVSWSAYSIGTLLGTLPVTVVTVAVGAAGGASLTGRPSDWLLPAAIGLIGLALSLLIPRLSLRRQPG